MSLSWLQRIGCVILAVLGLTACALDNLAARQEKTSELWGELVGGKTFGQTFISRRPNLYRIDLSTATYARTNSAPVIFHLRTDSDSKVDLVTVVIPGSQIQNERPTSIVFAVLPDSLNKSYYFFLESPAATPGNAITVYANRYDQYADGTAYQGGQRVNGDLVFSAYSREIFTPIGIVSDLGRRILADIPFWTGYVLLLILAGAILTGRPS